MLVRSLILSVMLIFSVSILVGCGSLAKPSALSPRETADLYAEADRAARVLAGEAFAAVGR